MVHLFFCVQTDFHSTICNSSVSINSRKLTIFKCHWGKLKVFEMTSYYLSAKKPEFAFECKSLFQLLIQISTITSLIFKYSPHKSIPHQWVRHAPWLNEYPVWIKTHAELPQVPIKVSDSHTDTQTLYYTILTIDFIIIFSSAPASPFLIFTTGTSITLMACKNQPVGSGCQTLAFRWRAFFKKKNKQKKTWEGQKVETEDKCIQINPHEEKQRARLGLWKQQGASEEKTGRSLCPCKDSGFKQISGSRGGRQGGRRNFS